MLVNANKLPEAEPGIDMRTLFEKIGFEPHSPAQWEYCESDARFNIPCCGRRWGKSLSTGHRGTYKVFIPDTYNWIVGPTYKLGEKEFRVIWSDFQKLGVLKYCKKAYSVKQGDMRIQTPWNSILEVTSAEKPDGLLGEGLSHVIMSEAAKHTRSTWEQYLEPALSDLQGSCDFPSTPQGYNWYHGMWLLGQASQPSSNPERYKYEYKSWQFPSWTNPVRYPGGLKNSEIMRIRATASKTYFDQEYGAKFTSFAGAIYEEFDPRLHIKPHSYNPAWPNFLAFDFGFANPFVCLDIQVDPADNVYVWREYYSRYQSTVDHGMYLKERENPTGYHVDGMWGDPRGADEIATLSAIIGYVAAQDVPWKHGVETIKRFLKPQNDGVPKLFIDPSCVNLARQLEQLHVKEQTQRQSVGLDEFRGDGNIQHKTDDHAADALRYFMGPYFVLGAGAHLEDVYGTDYIGSESEDFMRLRTNILLDDSNVSLGREF